AVAIRLEGTASNRDAVGARVSIATESLRGVKVVTAGSGFLSQHSKELLFGLGSSRTLRTLVVEWPSGARQVFEHLPVDMRYRLTEGGELEREPLRRPSAPTAAGDPPPTPTAVHLPDATWMYEPFPVPDFAMPDL